MIVVDAINNESMFPMANADDRVAAAGLVFQTMETEKNAPKESKVS